MALHGGLQSQGRSKGARGSTRIQNAKTLQAAGHVTQGQGFRITIKYHTLAHCLSRHFRSGGVVRYKLMN